MKKVLIIIPAYNEEANIKNTVERIKNTKISNVILNYIVINDGSSDQTKKVLEENHMQYIDLVNNLGIGGAVQTGYRFAKYNDYDIAVQFDGDGQHDETYIETLINPLLAGECDFTIGSRFIGTQSEFKSSTFRRFGIKFLSGLIHIFTKQKVKDVTSGFRAANREIIKEFSKDYPSDYPEPETIVTLLKKHYKVKEIPVKMHERVGGVSSIRAFKSLLYMLKVSLAIIIAALGSGGAKYE